MNNVALDDCLMHGNRMDLTHIKNLFGQIPSTEETIYDEKVIVSRQSWTL